MTSSSSAAAAADQSPAADAASTDAATLDFALTYQAKRLVLPFARHATLQDLSDRIAADLLVPPANQKLLVAGRGLLKPPLADADAALALAALAGRKTMLVGSTTADIATLSARIAAATAPRPAFMKPAAPAPLRPSLQRARDDAAYTFHTLRVLPHLPERARALQLLERLRDDAGVRSAMRHFGFSVALLTEMDPVLHTTAHSKTLGLNRNRGEVVELRLRTDAYEGFRPYTWIRKTLCHELAHNTHGPHDEHFWSLCRQIERIVVRDDGISAGRRLDAGPRAWAAPPMPDDDGDDDAEHDAGGWTGGQFVLGSGSDGGHTVVSSAGGEVPAGSLSRREILLRAAEARLTRQRQAEDEGRR